MSTAGAKKLILVIVFACALQILKKAARKYGRQIEVGSLNRDVCFRFWSVCLLSALLFAFEQREM